MTEQSPAEAVFFAALERGTAAERAAYLDEACAGRPALRARVEKLLAAHPRVGDFLAEPPPGGTATVSAADFAVTRDVDGTRSIPLPTEAVGVLIAGRYKLLQQIGEGGMGTVWMADQTEPVKRRVAVKLIRTERGNSKTILTRFEAERQAIALMDHPHIAKLLDAGTEAGAPFFVMELVKGAPLTEYCDAHKLSIPDRLQLFMQICSAVQHAHQKGVIHRDLKPSNILVESHDGKPVPKVIDFGLAKATSGLQLTEHTLFTGFGNVMGTPTYMAPEQATFNAVDVDTRADVYALGVILYELLTGTTPLTRESIKKAALDEMLRLIREQEPPTPSSRLSTADAKPTVAANRQTEPAKLGRFVKGELDWIVLKALSKDRDRRYDTANGFAKDIERFLNHEPVQAGPVSAGYKLRKFVQRNKGQVIAAGLVLAALLLGIAGSTLGLFEAKRQERIAVAEAKKKEEARKKTREALDTLTSNALEEWFTREQNLSQVQKDVLRTLLDQYAEFAEESGEDIETKKGQVRALQRVGLLQTTLGDRRAAGQSLHRAADMAGSAERPISDDIDGLGLVAVTQTSLFRYHFQNSRYKESEPHEREALAARIRLRDLDPNRHWYRFMVATGHSNLSAILVELNRIQESEVELKAAVDELERLVREFPLDTNYSEMLSTTLHNQAGLAKKQGRVEEALSINARAIEMRRKQVREAPKAVVPEEGLFRCLSLRAELLGGAQRSAEVEPVLRESIRIIALLADAFPSKPVYRVWLAEAYTSISEDLQLQGRKQPAVDEAKRAVAVARAVADEFADEHLPPGKALVNAFLTLSSALRDIQSYPEAEGAGRSALAETDRLMQTFGKSSDLRALRCKALSRLANAIKSQARYKEQEAVIREQIATLVDLERENPELNWLTDLMLARFDLATALILRQNYEAAEVVLRAVGGDLDRLNEHERENRGLAYYFNMAKLTVGTARWEEADGWAGKAVDAAKNLRKKNPTNDNYREALVQCHWHRATAREQLKRFADAAADWGAATELADNTMDRAFYMAHRGGALARGGDAKGAAVEFAAAIRQADTALKGERLAGITLYDGAGVYAMAAGRATDPTASEMYAAEAVRLLGRAAAGGFLNDPSQRQTLSSSDEYAAIKGREDFKKLVADLEAKFPPPKEVLPPPRKE